MRNHLTAEEAAGLWHAVEWMKLCLRHEDMTTPEALAVERTRLAAARRGLAKVQRARRENSEDNDTLTGAISLLERYGREIVESHTNPATGQIDEADAATDIAEIIGVAEGLAAVRGFRIQPPT